MHFDSLLVWVLKILQSRDSTDYRFILYTHDIYSYVFIIIIIILPISYIFYYFIFYLLSIYSFYYASLLSSDGVWCLIGNDKGEFMCRCGWFVECNSHLCLMPFPFYFCTAFATKQNTKLKIKRINSIWQWLGVWISRSRYLMIF